MTQNEFKLIDAINRDGIGNSFWGLCDSDVNASVYSPVFDEMLPPHLYIFGDDYKIYGSDLEMFLKNGYDRKLYYAPTHYIAFFWLQM